MHVWVHVCNCVHVRLNLPYKDNAPPRRCRLSNEKPSDKYGISPLSYWLRVFPGAQNNAGHCYGPWFPTRTWRQDPITDDITLRGHGMWIKQVGVGQESSSLLATFNSPGRCFWWEPKVRKPSFWVLPPHLEMPEDVAIGSFALCRKLWYMAWNKSYAIILVWSS